jgi:hypothetical protein
MKAKDFDPLFIAPSFLFLSVLCFGITFLALVGAFALHKGYIVLGFVFFLLGYTAGRIGIQKSKAV